MADTLTLTELNSLHVELLPARTVLSMFTLGTEGASVGDNGTNGQNSNGTPTITVLDIPVKVPTFGK
ncbi:MAG: hypothetical protein ACRDTX_32160 [Pseudonocardiaceae bacterium]